ncbi:MAG: ABC transporter permease subunit [Spirochaetaceae bacterium]|jgi:NitT/TauT family transport system permease protein|nr:ABC transporter permease subunit [Spirochaetaceae bacterium]
MENKKWYDDPKIAYDRVHWKPKSELWFWASVLSYCIALAESICFWPFEKVNATPYHIVLSAGIIALLVSYFVGLANPDFRKKLYHNSQFIFACGIALTVWDILTAKTGILSLPKYPSMAEIISVMYEDRRLLWVSTVYSMRLFFVGFITGTVLGLTTGTLIGWTRQWDYWLSPIIRITGIVPAVAWFPIAIAVLPTSFATGVFLIFISSWFPVSSMMAAGISSTPRSLFEAAKTLGGNNRYLLFRVAVPHALPSMFIGILTATAFSFTTLVVSEMVGAKAGLGFYINWARGWGIYSKVYAAIIIIAIEFSIILKLINTVKGRVLSWQKGILK